MNSDINYAASQIAAMRPHQTHGKEKSSDAWRKIEALREQNDLIVDVQRQLPGSATTDDAIRWLDQNCPDWRLGPAPRGAFAKGKR